MPFDLDWACSSQGLRGNPTVRLPWPEAVLAGQGWYWPLVKRAAMSGVAPGEDAGQCRAIPC